MTPETAALIVGFVVGAATARLLPRAALEKLRADIEDEMQELREEQKNSEALMNKIAALKAVGEKHEQNASHFLAESHRLRQEALDLLAEVHVAGARVHALAEAARREARDGGGRVQRHGEDPERPEEGTGDAAG